MVLQLPDELLLIDPIVEQFSAQEKSHAPTVVIAMSGGVDSSVAAAILSERGYNCIGIMMRLWTEIRPGIESTNKCCSLESVDDARRVADKLGIPFYLINVEKPFKQLVVDPFIEQYSQGLTPNPCIACNRRIRFDYLLNYARKLGADFLATGHYARLKRQPNGEVHLLKGVDEGKDQSYVLSVLGQDELRSVLFPVGEYQKSEVRQMAAERGLPTASKHDSMDLCFVADNDYRRFLRERSPQSMEPGPIVDRAGQQRGQHDGLAGYTIGQRKGLGIGGAREPLYALELDMTRNTLVIGTKEELGRSNISVHNVNWTVDRSLEQGMPVQCMIRYRANAAACRLYPDKNGTVDVHFDFPQYGVAPGQGAVFYYGSLCLGGGIIAP